MKKKSKLLLSLLLLSFFSTQAQFETGKTVIGISSLWGVNSGNTGLSSSSGKFKSDGFESEPIKSFGVNLSPRVRRMFTKDAAFGIEFHYSYNKADNSLDDNVKTNQISAGPFLRYYIPSGKIRPIIEVGCSFGSSKEMFDFSNSQDFESKYNLFSYGGGAGIAIPLGDFGSFDTFLAYNYFQSKRKEENINNSRSITNSLGIRLGFSIYLGNTQS